MGPFAFDNSYARLPARLFAQVGPTAVAAPRLIAVNAGLAELLAIDPAALATPEAVSWLAGNGVPPGAEPIAAAYAGHQFGHFNPQLGDGRAILLGEVVGRDGLRRDIQLKGAGRTPWSRGGDGRAWIGPVLREYLVSEAMAALGVPTTRALAAVATGESVWREAGALPGAVLTRVAASHIRVGTFQFLAARRDAEALRALADHVIARHYPQADGVPGLLAGMMAAQARTVARWMALGFVHGVMNTDNCAVSGETIDYGPCAFVDGFDPGAVFSSIDHGGRYAWGNQPRIVLWNIAQFATALVPLMPDADAAVETFTAILDGFADLYEAEWMAAFGVKIGIAAPGAEARARVEELLALMAAGESDFTLTFAALGTPAARDLIADRDAFDAWEARWRALSPDAGLMARANPQVIPRNHRVEEVIAAAVDGDLGPFHAMLEAVTRPFVHHPVFSLPPRAEERVTRTFCGT